MVIIAVSWAGLSTPVIKASWINAFTSATYGWYSRNPSLFCVAGDTTAGGQGSGLDFTWDSPVACENQAVVKAKVDLLLILLQAQERVDPVKTARLQATRLELFKDAMSLRDVLLNDAAKNYVVGKKIINLDVPRGVELQARNFLGGINV